MTQNQHPSTEQLAGYLDAPEAANQSTVRQHLLACQRCRVRIDQLTKLEMDIKYYVPRFAGQPASDNPDLIVERLVDNQPEPQTENQQQDLESRVKSDPSALKAALHYALHSTTMSHQLAPTTLNNKNNRQSGNGAATINAFNNWLEKIKQRLREPVPLWTMAPASLVLAIAIGISVILVGDIGNNNQLIAFQDNPRISFQQPGAPAGSIGFFHDAQTQSKPFDGLTVAIDNGGNLEFNWPAVTNATLYKLEIFAIVDDDAQLVREETSTAPSITFNNFSLSTKQHYKWQLSGTTTDNMTFRTGGDFLFVHNR